MEKKKEERVVQYYKETAALCAELSQWIETEEEKFQRELTEEEIQKKSDELHIKHNIPRLRQ